MKTGQVIGDRYLIQRFLGEGGMQYVYVAKDQLSERLVVLKTPKNKSADTRFKRGAIVAAKVNHPNVAKTLDYLEIGDDKYLLEELVEGLDLEAALLGSTKFIDPYLAAKVFHHLAKGVAAAHHANVIHRDLKPTNIMVLGSYSLSELKITDFGIAKMVEEEIKNARVDEASMQASQTVVGALPYMSPEAIETPQTVGKPTDIWSIGAMMFRVLTGQYPFESGLKAVSLIVAANAPVASAFVKANPQFAPLAESILKIALACMKKDPTKRPTADQLLLQCSELCYTPSMRRIGIVTTFDHNAFGFIATGTDQVFFHKTCVYGPIPAVGDYVMFADYDGGGKRRALPVVKLNKAN